MTSLQRREQLIRIGRALFADKGFEAVSVEEIASHAKVSKPIVYEHFGGKEGLYAVVVDREMQALTGTLTAALSDTTAHPRQIVERTALALLTYIEENAEGFKVLSRDSPSTDPAGSFSSLLGDISVRVEDLLTASFKRQKLSPKGVPYYAQMLVGMTVFTGQYWADRPKVNKEQLAAYIVDLAWHGLSRLDSKPQLRFEGAKAKRAADRAGANDSDASGIPVRESERDGMDGTDADGATNVDDATNADDAGAEASSGAHSNE
ncbi:TetR/AcrR family transcriptional regulator [Bifidobacterium eulemuris]|nr:TetR/AcrR family transcriptional regulator [Bifidobacterium eulemuris]QOL32141.1 TetR/AcrR family transcriptional regulator [Bifidobacterium eulemuris]